MGYVNSFGNTVRLALLIIGICWLQSSGLHAQKYHYYSGVISKYNLDVFFIELPDGAIEGYLLNNLTREKTAIDGEYSALGHYWMLCSSHPKSPFYRLLLREEFQQQKMVGHYYCHNNVRGNCELMEMTPPEEFEVRRDLIAFNEAYQLAVADFQMPFRRKKALFYTEPVAGKRCFEEDEGSAANNGFSPEPRNLLEISSLRMVLEDLKWENRSEKYTCKFYLQILSYYPTLTVLAVAEERIKSIKNSTDTSFQQTFSFATYQEIDGKSWQNTTKTAFPDYQKERLRTKLPTVDYSENESFFRLRFPGRPETMLLLNTPRVALFVPEGNNNMVLDWSWSEKGFVFR